MARTARIDPSASIGALAVIEAGAIIGPRVRVHPLVYVGADVEMGDGTRSTIRASCSASVSGWGGA